MQTHWYFDFISPYAYLHWQRLRPVLAKRAITPVPILLAAVLSAQGTKGPAEIPAKRTFAYRHLLWRASNTGVPLRFPPAHPFNPLPALRACIAAGNTPEAIDALFDWIWRQGNAGDSAQALAPVLATLGIAAHALDQAEVKDQLKTNTAQALAADVFGVPTLAVGGDLFWGEDAHDFAMAVLDAPALLHSADMQRVTTLPVGVRRI